jgi:hypothetical protein
MGIHIAVPEHIPTNLAQRIEEIISKIPILDHSCFNLEYQHDGDTCDPGDVIRAYDPDRYRIVLAITLPKVGVGTMYRVYRVVLTLTSASDHFDEMFRAVREKLCSMSENTPAPCPASTQDVQFAPYAIPALKKRQKKNVRHPRRASSRAHIDTNARVFLKLSNKDLALCLSKLHEAHANCEQFAIPATQLLIESGIFPESLRGNIPYILRKAQQARLLRQESEKVRRVVVYSLTESGHAFVARHRENS